jgi:putative hemolysin
MIRLLLALPLLLAAAIPPAHAIANPASVFCVKQGGRLEIRTGPGGGQIGMCILPDGRTVEEWAYYRSMHSKRPSR